MYQATPYRSDNHLRFENATSGQVRALARASSDSTTRFSASQPAQADDAMVASKARCTYFSSAYLMNGSWPS